MNSTQPLNTFEMLKNKKKPLIAAHRGLCLGNIPCNTPAAFEFALKNGADIIELDVSVTKDGELLCFHPGMERHHTTTDKSFLDMTAEEIEKEVRFVNLDDTPTQFPISKFKDVMLLLRDRCVVNVDKFWTAPEKIAAVIRECGMENQVIIKTGPHKGDIENVKKYAPDMPYMVVVTEKDDLEALIGDKELNFVGAEVVFESETSPFASKEYIKKLQDMGLLLWVNSIVFNHRSVLAAGHNDDVSAAGDPDYGWGWLYDRGYDIIQTDYTGFIQNYFKTR